MLRDLYIAYKESNPGVRISFSKWKILRKLEKTRERKTDTYNKLHRRYRHYRDRASALSEEVKDLKREIRSLKKQRPKVVEHRRVRRISRPNCKGCKRYERLLTRPIDAKYRNSVNILKFLIGLESVLNESDIDRIGCSVLCLAKIQEHLIRTDVSGALSIGPTHAFNTLKSLTEKGYLSVIEIRPTEGHKVKSHYFITQKGEERLSEIFHKISRRHYNIIKGGKIEKH